MNKLGMAAELFHIRRFASVRGTWHEPDAIRRKEGCQDAICGQEIDALRSDVL